MDRYIIKLVCSNHLNCNGIMAPYVTLCKKWKPFETSMIHSNTIYKSFICNGVRCNLVQVIEKKNEITTKKLKVKNMSITGKTIGEHHYIDYNGEVD